MWKRIAPLGSDNMNRESIHDLYNKRIANLNISRINPGVCGHRFKLHLFE